MKTLKLIPLKATAEIMKDLENKGLISRLTAQNAVGKTHYTTAPEYGTHKLISVSIKRTDMKTGIGYHPDKEEFLLISNLPDARPLYLIISELSFDELNKKVSGGQLAPEDFYLLEMPYGDPEISFFTMNENVIHGEVTTEAEKPGPVFYVTEPADLSSVGLDFGEYELIIGD